MASAYWHRRNEKARALGYKNYYDYRAHEYGRRPPEAPRARGAELRRLRGHGGPGGLQRLIEGGRVELLIVDPEIRDRKSGKWTRVRLDVTLDDGESRDFWLSGKRLDQEYAHGIGDLLRAHGVMFFDAYAILAPEPTFDVPAEEAA